jgi:hypothetical protein
MVDAIIFVLGGMALGFVIGATIMDKIKRREFANLEATLRAMDPAHIAKAILEHPLPDDGGESFHEECGDR